ncbi:MAG: hypothetical protein MUE42_15755, partial [Opitutaceae bacterium]|nr:hypothetical protein [Opitutaceae bacterium]
SLAADNRSLARRLPSPEVTADLRADREVLVKLRAEIEELRKLAPAMVQPEAESASPPWPGATMRDAPMASARWQNRGRNTPTDVIETALWAAAGGETAVLQECLILDGAAQKRAKALFDRLLPELQARYVSPERLVAFMTAVAVPLGKAQILPATANPQAPASPNSVQTFRVNASTASGTARVVNLTTRKASYGWKLVVPEEAVERYELELTGFTARRSRPRR